MNRTARAARTHSAVQQRGFHAGLSTLRRDRIRLRTLADPEVVAASLNGDERAFPELVERHQVRLLNFVYRFIGDRERAEDVTQETFLRVYRHLHRYNPAAKFSTWIFTIASNLAKNELRNRACNPIVLFQTLEWARQNDEPAIEFADPAPGPDELQHLGSLRAIVERAVTSLPPRHRQVFVLREVDAKPYAEIAVIVGCKVATVKSRLHRARAAYRQREVDDQ